MMDLSVVIPVYGAAKILPSLADRLLAVLNDMHIEYELIFVNDDSPDEAWDVLRNLQEKHETRVRIIRLTKNFGQHSATMCGLRRASGSFVLTMDDDLQHPPEQIPVLWNAIQVQNLDVVYGKYQEKMHGNMRNIGSKLLSLVFRRVFGVPVGFSSFRIIRSEVLKGMQHYPHVFVFIDGILAGITSRIGCVAVPHHARAQGRSGYRMGKLLFLSVNVLTSFSLFPLQVATWMGFASSFVGAVLGLWIVYQALAGNVTVPGYASLFTAVLFMGGVQLLALGVIGEYLGRVYQSLNRDLPYVERESQGFETRQ
ncbi:MAG: glycosyltransferase family 2 protein [bacterium]